MSSRRSALDPPGRFGPTLESGSPGGLRLRRALQRLETLVDWERRDRAAGSGRQMRVDLGPARDLMARLGSPHTAFRSVHVAGTKGKGSVAALIEAALRRAGQATGTYASPHVECVNERVRLDGRPVSDGELAEGLECALEARDAALEAGGAGAAATWFDVVTAAAFSVFARARVPWAVVECGLGGRLDSTNVVAAEVCVLTNVELEHTAILGSTRRAIALEKAGILERGGVLVTGLAATDEVAPALSAHVSALGAEVRWGAGPEPAPLEGRNRALAGRVLDELGDRGCTAERAVGGRAAGVAVGAWLLDDATVAAARLPGRMERLQRDGVPVVLDGAHVASSLRAALDELAGWEGLSGLPVVVFGVGRDKDAGALLKELRGRVDSLLCTSRSDGPAVAPEDLARAARELGISAEPIDLPQSALSRALKRASNGGWVLIVGSLHLLGSLRGELEPAH